MALIIPTFIWIRNAELCGAVISRRFQKRDVNGLYPAIYAKFIGAHSFTAGEAGN
jgi:hypothetical protein